MIEKEAVTRELTSIRSIVFDFIMTFVIGIFFFLSLTYPAKARFVPLIIATPTFVIALGRMVYGINILRKERRAEEKFLQEEEKNKNLNRLRKESAAVAWILLLALMVWFIGFLWSIPVYIFLALRVRAHEPWKISVILSLGAWLFMYGLFSYVLKIQFASGLLLKQFGL